MHREKSQEMREKLHFQKRWKSRSKGEDDFEKSDDDDKDKG